MQGSTGLGLTGGGVWQSRPGAVTRLSVSVRRITDRLNISRKKRVRRKTKYWRAWTCSDRPDC